VVAYLKFLLNEKEMVYFFDLDLDFLLLDAVLMKLC